LIALKANPYAPTTGKADEQEPDPLTVTTR